jgi:hypothetical protein
VGWAYGVSEAALAQAFLNAHGIRTFKHSWYHATMNWGLMHALGGIAICVPLAQADDAFAVLAGFEISRRPRSLLRRLLAAVVSVLVLSFAGFPPPPSGCFAARPRSTVTRYSPAPPASAV